MNHTELAQRLVSEKENVLLLYAFNSNGKTRLSVEFKNVTKAAASGKHSGVYYNAFSEDLFVWDNDTENGEQSIQLDVQHCDLNRFHSLLNEEAVRNKLAPYRPSYDFRFISENPEKGIESIIFFNEASGGKPIKISRGEERIFVWCFFLTLFEVEGWTDKQDAHIFIDDPVSSLDDHNIFITAATVFNLIESHFDKRKIIVTSHHLGFISILSDWLKKGEKAPTFVNRDGTKKFKVFILEREANDLNLSNPKSAVLLYHLRLLELLEKAYKTEIYTYHFALLRQVLENIASFLGVGQFGYVF